MEAIDRSALLVMHAYNDYANQLVLDTALKMKPEELSRNSSPSHGSVNELLLHIVLCEYGFILRCKGIPLDSIQEDFDTLSFQGIRDLYTKISEMRKDYLDHVDEKELNEIVSIQIAKHPLNLSRWQMLAQALIHSTHHRGELSIVMTGLGYPLPTLDPVIQFVCESGQDWPL
jgi:uncharacterized damage-inducible protein DinB